MQTPEAKQISSQPPRTQCPACGARCGNGACECGPDCNQWLRNQLMARPEEQHATRAGGWCFCRECNEQSDRLRDYEEHGDDDLYERDETEVG